jgi:hypothetical protein
MAIELFSPVPGYANALDSGEGATRLAPRHRVTSRRLLGDPVIHRLLTTQWLFTVSVGSIYPGTATGEADRLSKLRKIARDSGI